MKLYTQTLKLEIMQRPHLNIMNGPKSEIGLTLDSHKSKDEYKQAKYEYDNIQKVITSIIISNEYKTESKAFRKLDILERQSIRKEIQADLNY